MAASWLLKAEISGSVPTVYGLFLDSPSVKVERPSVKVKLCWQLVVAIFCGDSFYKMRTYSFFIFVTFLPLKFIDMTGIERTLRWSLFCSLRRQGLELHSRQPLSALTQHKNEVRKRAQ